MEVLQGSFFLNSGSNWNGCQYNMKIKNQVGGLCPVSDKVLDDKVKQATKGKSYQTIQSPNNKINQYYQVVGMFSLELLSVSVLLHQK
jgi:hypothetical protein